MIRLSPPPNLSRPRPRTRVVKPATVLMSSPYKITFFEVRNFGNKETLSLQESRFMPAGKSKGKSTSVSGDPRKQTKKNAKKREFPQRKREVVIYVVCGESFKARRGSGFYEIVCIFANMSCLCIHLVTLFNLP